MARPLAVVLITVALIAGGFSFFTARASAEPASPLDTVTVAPVSDPASEPVAPSLSESPAIASADVPDAGIPPSVPSVPSSPVLPSTVPDDTLPLDSAPTTPTTESAPLAPSIAPPDVGPTDPMVLPPPSLSPTTPPDLPVPNLSSVAPTAPFPPTLPTTPPADVPVPNLPPVAPTAPLPPTLPPTTPANVPLSELPSTKSPQPPDAALKSPSGAGQPDRASSANSIVVATVGATSQPNAGSASTDGLPRLQQAFYTFDGILLSAGEAVLDSIAAPVRSASFGDYLSRAGLSLVDMTPGSSHGGSTGPVSAGLLLSALALFAVFLMTRLSNVALFFSSLTYTPVRPPS